jgi:hypothetical protein
MNWVLDGVGVDEVGGGPKNSIIEEIRKCSKDLKYQKFCNLYERIY